MEGLKLCSMTCQLKSDCPTRIPHYVFALGVSIAAQILELFSIVPQKKCVLQEILVVFSIVPVLLLKTR